MEESHRCPERAELSPQKRTKDKAFTFQFHARTETQSRQPIRTYMFLCSSFRPLPPYTIADAIYIYIYIYVKIVGDSAELVCDDFVEPCSPRVGSGWSFLGESGYYNNRMYKK